MIKYLLPEETALDEVGLYGTVYKFAMLLIILNQVFRFAAEPFVFKHFKQRDKQDPTAKDSKEGLAQTTDWFVVVLSIALLGTLCCKVFIEILIDKKFEEALVVLPVLLLANVFYSITTQLSFWYKIIKKTSFGILITVSGAIITLLGTFFLIPRLGYEGAAWATLASYSTMMCLSSFLGQRFNPYPYNTAQNILCIALAIICGTGAWIFSSIYLWPQFLFMGLYVGAMWFLLRGDIKILRQTPKDAIPNLPRRWRSPQRKMLILVLCLFAAWTTMRAIDIDHAKHQAKLIQNDPPKILSE